MDTRFSDEDLAFRDEVRAFFVEQWDAELIARLHTPSQRKAAIVDWQKRLQAKGWIAPNWPVEVGGAAWSVTQNYIFERERVAAGAMDTVPFGVTMVGPVIHTFGTEAQKARFLPGILSSDDWWCQGYSEPGAGSDLASLQTRARRDGDDYVVDGSKIWTSYAQYADWIFCLVRTDTESKPQKGISFLLIDMKTPGITVDPIISIDGAHTLNQVYFDNVRVPLENRIGDENKGWTYAKALLAHERTSIAGVAESTRRLERLRGLLQAEAPGGASLAGDPVIALRFAEIEAELMALEFTELKSLADSAAHGAPGPESSLLKLQGTEIQQRIEDLTLDSCGLYGGVLREHEYDPVPGHDLATTARREYFYGRAASIYGGSNEVQRNIIAKAVLGL